MYGASVRPSRLRLKCVVAPPNTARNRTAKTASYSSSPEDPMFRVGRVLVGRDADTARR
ncbi:hypothetical protein K439DRAFT_1630963 [Ramaria rubella]|nr:hypothetical protein K439DRAFT_1630963 [Ramaria rubella]